MLAGLPALTYYLCFCLTFADGALADPRILAAARAAAPTATSLSIYGAWLLLQAGLHVAAPGKRREGMPLADGSRLTYRLNGWFAFWTTWAVVLVAVRLGWVVPTIAYDQFGPLLTTANLVAFGLAIFLFWWGARSADPARTGDPLDDFLMGVALNPRAGRFDFKFFCESRPGLILWVVIDASLAAKQYELVGHLTAPMILVNAFQFLYVADYFYNEDAIVTTWDIKHERFGWMLCWGGLVWVPFTYTIQAYYLVTHPHELPPAATAAIVALNVAGYAIFRGANIQKHRFRTNPDRPVWGRPAAHIRTASGALLLTSGWWGRARHLNYFGDLLMGLAWCLPAGFERPVPYFYIVYVSILLLHRERRDHAFCARKYGKDWDAYCRKVPWRIIPGLY
jgi:protein-S-isoprenylcysteine O-methyltransferase Ste14